MILAFMYTDCPGVKNAFAGAFDSKEEAFDTLVGNYEKGNNLELLDTETYGIKCYEWKPLYIVSYLDTPDYKMQPHISEPKCRVTLRNVYDDKDMIETTAWELNRNNGKYYHLAQAGRWNRTRDD